MAIADLNGDGLLDLVDLHSQYGKGGTFTYINKDVDCPFFNGSPVLMLFWFANGWIIDRFARQHLITHRGVIDEARHDH